MPARASRRETARGGLLSIGALSAASGVPIETIRTWERRYGFPVARRKPSGHRVYDLSTVPRLRRIAQAIARGHRAAEVLTATERELEALLASMPRLPAPPTGVGPQGDRPPIEARDSSELLELVRAFDAERLRRAFEHDWSRLGPVRFLEDRAAAFLTAVGDAWSSGALDVRHEHFASGVLGDFLRALRAPLEQRASGPFVVLATLPGELHGLGLDMSAIVFALAGWRVLILGVDTPIAQLSALASEAPIAAVALSCAPPQKRGNLALVRTLRRKLPANVALIVGGSGAPSKVTGGGVEIMPSLSRLDRWLHPSSAA